MVFSDENKTVTKTHKCTQVYAVTCVEELKSVQTAVKCNLFAFSSISAKYLQKI